jgi:hypothetical protein
VFLPFKNIRPNQDFSPATFVNEPFLLISGKSLKRFSYCRAVYFAAKKTN